MVAYIGYLKHNPEQHKESNYRMPGGKYGLWYFSILCFHFVILLINSSTRLAVLFIPVWVLVLFLMYQNTKRIS